MPRTTRLPLVAAALLSLLAPLALTASDAQAGTAAPVLDFSLMPGPGNPLQVDPFDPDDPPASPATCAESLGAKLYDPRCTDVWASVYASEDVDDVVATVVEHEGLYVDPLVTTIGTLQGDGAAGHAALAVRALTPGLHTLTVEVTAPGAQPQRISLPYLWRSGGPPIAGTHSLAGRLYGKSGLDSYPCGPNGTCRFRTASRVAFLDDTRSSAALARDGKSGCGPGVGCTPYRHDDASGLLQLGDDTIGRITSAAAFIDGSRYVRMAYPRPGQRLEGWWSYGADVEEGRGVVDQDLKLHKNGRFRLTYFVNTVRYTGYGEPEIGTSYGRKLSGTYAIRREGRLVLHDPQRGKKVATLAILTTSRGKPRAGTKGVWLDLLIHPPESKPFVDGNPLIKLG